MCQEKQSILLQELPWWIYLDLLRYNNNYRHISIEMGVIYTAYGRFGLRNAKQAPWFVVHVWQ